ncbi:MAG: DNA-binding protein [Bacteroidota bacterium]
MVISFEKLRKIKDSLSPGSMKKIADELTINPDTVRNFFGGTHYENGTAAGVHFEKGPNGGLVKIENTEILDCAMRLLKQQENKN